MMQRAARVGPDGAGGGWSGRGRSGPGGRVRLRSGKTLLVGLAAAGAAAVSLCVAASPRGSATHPSAGAGHAAPAEGALSPAAATSESERSTAVEESPAPDTAFPPFERYRPLLERNPFAPRLPKKASPPPSVVL